MIAAGVDVNAEDRFGNLPFDLAVSDDEVEISQLLLNAGATSRNPELIPTPTPSVYRGSFFGTLYTEYHPGEAHLTSEYDDYQLRLATNSWGLGVGDRKVYEYLACEIYDLLEYPTDLKVVQQAIESGKLRDIPNVVARKTGEPERVREAINNLEALEELVEAMQIMAPTILWDYCANDVFEGYDSPSRRDSTRDRPSP